MVMTDTEKAQGAGAPLRGKVAIVTGSTSGIGLSIARAMAAAGADVAMNGFGDAAAIEQMRTTLAEEHGVKVIYEGADVSEPKAVADMMARAAERLGPIDIVVNNAGIQYVSPIESFPTEKWNAILAINLSAAFHVTRAVIPAMKQRGAGRIINLASLHGLVASPFKSAYVAAKHGLIGLTKTVALEVAEHGITCNAICPGYVLTPLVEKQIDDLSNVPGAVRETVIRESFLFKHPNRRFVSMEEVATVAIFLAGDLAASITGAAITIDGGWIAQ